jgi:hypothetical protein
MIMTEYRIDTNDGGYILPEALVPDLIRILFEHNSGECYTQLLLWNREVINDLAITSPVC